MREWVSKNLHALEMQDDSWFVEAVFNEPDASNFKAWLELQSFPIGQVQFTFHFNIQWFDLTTDQMLMLKLAWGGY